MSITIVTAFFDIGRGAWSVENGHPSYLGRSTDKYFKYFSNLAELENDMIVFTSQEFVTRIKEIRGDKPTNIIPLDLNKKFIKCMSKIAEVQNDIEFKKKVNEEQLKNPEYWSAEYVLINNLKSYFLKTAIRNGLVKTELAAWVDFGYCRNLKTLGKIKKWNYNFLKDKVHIFSIKKEFILNKESVDHAVLNNQPYIIGGVIVATPPKWLEFSELVYSCQKDMLSKKIIDDDQGVYLQALLRQPDLFEIHYLGKDCWFDVFKRYDETTHLNLKNRFKKLMGYF
jgi:protein YibB